MKLVREHINEKFTEDSPDPIFDMGIGFPSLIKNVHKEIFKEDQKNTFFVIDPWSFKKVKKRGVVELVKTSGAVGRNQQHRTGTRFMIFFNERNFYSSTNVHKNNNPVRINKKEYAIELINKANIMRCFSDVEYNAHNPFVVIFKIKEEYRKFFTPGHHLS
jgi:hypothetical protein